MKRWIITIGILSVCSMGWYSISALASRTADVAPAIASGVAAASWAAKEFESCELSCMPPASEASAVELKAKGKILGHFDPAMSGVCQNACATRLTYDPAKLAAQPGAKMGQLTQCPVSGVVFKVGGMSGKVQVGEDRYFTCCGSCASKLRSDPSHYVQT